MKTWSKRSYQSPHEIMERMVRTMHKQIGHTNETGGFETRSLIVLPDGDAMILHGRSFESYRQYMKALSVVCRERQAIARMTFEIAKYAIQEEGEKVDDYGTEAFEALPDSRKRTALLFVMEVDGLDKETWTADLILIDGRLIALPPVRSAEAHDVSLVNQNIIGSLTRTEDN